VLIRRMSEENPLWGAPRIHGDLLKLGFAVSQSTITKYVARTSNPPSQSWRTCVRNHAPQIGNAASRQLFFGSPLAPPGWFARNCESLIDNCDRADGGRG
jgi:hypothetical protein